jgi:hypothetical protein
MLQGSCSHGSFRSRINSAGFNETSDTCPTDAVVVGMKEYEDAGNPTLRVTYLQRSAGEDVEDSTSFAAMLGGMSAFPEALAGQPLLFSSALTPAGEAARYQSFLGVLVGLFVSSLSLLCAVRYCRGSYSAMDRSKYVALP